MKNILTIDFDIIMAPSIEAYNNRVPQTNWETLMQEPLSGVFMADYSIYQKLTEYLYSLVSFLKKEDIHFINNHDDILDFIDKNEEYNIINIDHHHDTGYLIDASETRVGASNWVLFIPKLKGYTWIKNENSEKILEKNNKNIYKQGNIIDVDLRKLPKPDEIYICRSVPWVPPTQIPLLYTWMDILNIYYNTHFDFYIPKRAKEKNSDKKTNLL